MNKQIDEVKKEVEDLKKHFFDTTAVLMDRIEEKGRENAKLKEMVIELAEVARTPKNNKNCNNQLSDTVVDQKISNIHGEETIS